MADECARVHQSDQGEVMPQIGIETIMTRDHKIPMKNESTSSKEDGNAVTPKTMVRLRI